jgi:regulator of sirC expression with transglutaminase-like and TPR domain
MTIDLFDDFRRSVERPEDQIDLARAALEIARDDCPSLDVGEYLSRIDQLAVAVKRRVDGGSNIYRTIAALNYVLFQEQGFHGNRENYYDPKNSFLNEVIDRNTGIPITLSILYMEVAQRVGLLLRGVSFPGHFLVKYVGDDEEIVIDPFNKGEIKSDESLSKLLDDLYQRRLALHRDLLSPVTKKQIIKRVLNNLKMIYLRENNLVKALAVLQRLVIVDPRSEEDIRDRGAVYLKLECFNYALADFENYIQIAPDATDAGAVKEQIINLTKQVRQIH